MAFNLNKNDDKASEKPANSSNFDLTKNEKNAETLIKTNKWPIFALAILLIGIAIWFFTYQTNRADKRLAQSNNNSGQPIDSALSTNPSASVPEDTFSVVSVQKEIIHSTDDKNQSSIKAIAVSSLNRKVVANFTPGSSAMRNTNRSLIKEILAYMAQNPNTNIDVNGYASSDGSFEVNNRISQARADNFRQYLISNNINQNQITAFGKGIQNPIASNQSAAGRKQNRRVEVMLRND